MSGLRTWMELVRALGVLALIFLNFAHQPAIAAPAAGDLMQIAASQSYCGAPITDEDDRAPCQACRIGSGADLPPVAVLPSAPVLPATRLGVEPSALIIARYDPGPAGARAPPSV